MVFSRTISEDKNVKGIVFENVGGRFAAFSKMVIDCTGDGNVAADAGCDFEIGEEGNYKKCQAMTLMFLVGNIPQKYEKGIMLYEKMKDVYEKGGRELPFKVPYLIPIPGARFGVIQFTHMYEYNPLDASDLTKANIEGRRQMIECFELLTKYDSEFENLELIMSSPVLGVRESRRIIGEYTLNVRDITEGTKFEDAVASVTFLADFHTKSNKGQKTMKVKPYEIPMRSLIPKGYDGILVAGRCISGTREAMASYRVTGNCCQMGENIGYAVAEAIERRINIRNVEPDSVLLKNTHN